MATKQDLIGKIEMNFDYVEGFVERNEDTIHSGQTRKVYIAQVLVLQSGKMLEKGYSFIVFNEGEVDEEAYWMSSGDPTPPPEGLTFQQEVEAWLQSKIDATVGDYKVRMYDQLAVQPAQERARCRLTLENVTSGDGIEQSVAIWKDG